jgi:Tfp pilus assembly protein PilV
MSLFSKFKLHRSTVAKRRSPEYGFTLMETAVALVIMMVVGLGVASLFAYATQSNTRADDRELAMAIAQKRMEWFRTIPFTRDTRHQAYSYPNGGLGATSADGVVETVTNAGRTYVLTTIVQDVSFVPNGAPDQGEPTVKRIQLSVTPAGAASSATISISTQRSTSIVGIY